MNKTKIAERKKMILAKTHITSLETLLRGIDFNNAHYPSIFRNERKMMIKALLDLKDNLIDLEGHYDR